MKNGKFNLFDLAVGGVCYYSVFTKINRVFNPPYGNDSLLVKCGFALAETVIANKIATECMCLAHEVRVTVQSISRQYGTPKGE